MSVSLMEWHTIINAQAASHKTGLGFWQHNDNGRVNGVLSPVDFDVFSGDSVAFSQLLIK